MKARMAWTTLLERQSQLETAARALQDARARTGRALVVQARAGLGKSALLDRIARDAEDAGLRVLRARADEAGQHVPYGVLQQLLRVPLRDAAARGTADRSGAAMPALAAMGLADHAAPLASPQVAHSAWWLLGELAEQQPTVLVVDDMHWSDRGSLSTLAYVAGRLEDMPLLVLAGLRTNTATEDDSAVGAIRSAPMSRVVTLAPLGRDAAAELVRSLEPGADDAFIEHAVAVTGGVPFLLVEHALHQTDADDDSSSGFGGELPPRVLASVRRRLDTGDRALGRVAAAAATLGTRATVARVAATAGVDVQAADMLLATLERLDLVERSEDRVGFLHPLLRSATLAVAADETLRRRLARRAADAVEEDGEAVTVVASFLLDASLAGDQAVVNRLLSAAAVAVSAGAPADAEAFLRRALAEPIRQPATRVSARVLLGRAKALQGDLDGAEAEWVAALENATDVRVRGDLHAETANLLLGASRHADAMVALRAAASELDALPQFTRRARMLRARADAVEAFLAGTADLDHVVAAMPEDPAEDTHEDRVVLAVLATMFAITNAPAERARMLARRALADGALLRDETVDGTAFHNATSALLWTDDFEVLDAALEQAIADARARGSVLGHAAASMARGVLRARRGDLSHALADFEATLEARSASPTAYLPYAALAAARAHRDLGNDASAAELATLAVTLTEPHGERYAIVAHSARGFSATLVGRHQEALRHHLLAGEAGGEVGLGSIGMSDWRQDAVEAAARAGRAVEVRELAARMLATARGVGAPRVLGTSLRAAAAIEPDRALALTMLEESCRVLRKGGLRQELAQSLAALGRTLGASEREAAVAALTEAHQLACGCDARPLADELATDLALLGAGGVAPERPRGGVHSLTPGELRVAELAASGMTNRQIAQALFVTVKAVEWHLSRAYPKLGIKGRRELPAALDEA